MATATNLQEARLIEDAGIDAIVAQGIEAGGHRGMFDVQAKDEELTTNQLVALLAKHTQLPIIATGELWMVLILNKHFLMAHLRLN